jgi:hypothetical protein
VRRSTGVRGLHESSTTASPRISHTTVEGSQRTRRAVSERISGGARTDAIGVRLPPVKRHRADAMAADGRLDRRVLAAHDEHPPPEVLVRIAEVVADMRQASPARRSIAAGACHRWPARHSAPAIARSRRTGAPLERSVVFRSDTTRSNGDAQIDAAPPRADR